MDIIDTCRTFDEDYAKMRYTLYIQKVNTLLENHQKPHNKKYKQGFFIPKRPLKVMNIMETTEPQPIVWRSSWEKDLCEWLDTTDAIVRWGSEIVQILYRDPTKNKMSFYTPDFYVEYLDANKVLRKTMIEVKPLKEATLKKASNGWDKILVAKNAMKWVAANEYCKKRGITFKVMHEHNLGIL